MKLPKKFIIDTNVPLTANKALTILGESLDLIECIEKCVALIESVVNTKEGLVMDNEDHIFNEYCKNFSFSGDPGLGNKFFKWLHQNRYMFPEQDRVCISIDGESFKEFPDHPGLKDFDISDRKFIATANAHPATPKPTIFEATDSKWWGWRKALAEVGINVHFLCERYVELKYKSKFPDTSDV